MTEAKTHLANAARDFFNHSHEVIYTTDLNGFILAVNDRLVELSQYRGDYLVGRHVRMMKSGIHDVSFYKDMWDTIKSKGSWTGEITNRKRNGDLYTIITTIKTIYEDGMPVRYLSVGTDISSVIQTRELYAGYAYYDSLTGLPNRRMLDDILRIQISTAERNKTMVGILFMDLDGFKFINDNYGHAVGDRYLAEIGGRLKGLLREGDFISRLGGDEFVVVLSNLSSMVDIHIPIERILEAVKKPVVISGIMMSTTCSIGVSFHPAYPYRVEGDVLIRQADQAMYIAKMAGKNQYHVYDSSVDDIISTRDEILEQAIISMDCDHFVLYYQPKVSMSGGNLVGVEALLRWQHPVRGLLYPDSFLPHIRNTTIGTILDDMVIVMAMRQYNEWLKCGLDIPISINIEPKYLTQCNFYEKIVGYIEKYRIPYGRISFEILETSCLQLTPELIVQMKRCIELGVTFEMDDFGVGYSSISNVLNTPIDTIKIDRSFIIDILKDEYHTVTVQHIIDLSTRLGIRCIAEGVETVEHGRILMDMGCDIAQGYVISRPIEADDLPSWLREWVPPIEWVL